MRHDTAQYNKTQSSLTRLDKYNVKTDNNIGDLPDISARVRIIVQVTIYRNLYDNTGPGVWKNRSAPICDEVTGQWKCLE